MTDTEPTAEPTPDEGTIVLPAIRLHRQWITPADQHGIVVHGRTLAHLHTGAQQALALRFGTATPPPLQIHPHSPELDALAEARLLYHTALREAVQALRDDKTSWTDIAQACHVRIAEAQAVLDHHDGDALPSSWPRH
ncbi:hypothetical protein [Nonomuraea sp. NPDC049400]|uniref:hypothetical protein n=1 Tax=Nonomuraea sp. NPDC049400 TaxID=3364352 RepID=UPI003791E84B